MPFHPGLLLSFLLLIACLGINAAHYPSVRRMLDNRTENVKAESVAAFQPVRNVPQATKAKTSGLNRPIPLETSPLPKVAASPPAAVKVPEPKKIAEQKSEPKPEPKSEPKKAASEAPKTEPDKANEKKVELAAKPKPEPKQAPKTESVQLQKPIVKSEAKPVAAAKKTETATEASYAAFAPLVPTSLQHENVSGLGDCGEVPPSSPALCKEAPAPAYAGKVEPLPDTTPKTDLKPLEPKKRLKPLPPEETIDMILERPVMYEVSTPVVVPAP